METKSKPFAYYFKGKDDGETADLYIYGVIGWDVFADDVVKGINAFTGKALNIHINSLGGDCLEATAIFNAIKSFNGSKTAIIDSMAGSAASYIMLACDKIKAFENSTIFIHNPLVQWACGNASELEKIADDLKKFEKIYLDAYMAKTGKDETDIRIAMDDETLFTAQEALEYGLIDEIAEQSSEEADAQAKTPFKMVAQYFTKQKLFKATKSQEQNSKTEQKVDMKTKEEILSALNALKDKIEDEAIKTEIDAIYTALEALEVKETETGDENDEPKGEGEPQPKKGDDEEDDDKKKAQAPVDTKALVDEAVAKTLSALLGKSDTPTQKTEATKKTGIAATIDAYTKKYVNKKQ